MLAEVAALTSAFKAAHVNLDGRFREWEVRRSQTRAGVVPINLFDKDIQHALKIAQRDALVDDKALHLGEHRGMRRVIVRAEYLAGRQNLDRRLLLLHDMNLAGGRLCPEQEFRRQVEGILHVSRRMILRCIQRREVVIIILNLGALVDREAHPREDIDQLVPDLRDRMQAADLSVRGRQRDVDLLALIAGLKLLLLHPLIERVEVIDRPALELVDLLSEIGLLRRLNLLHVLHELTDSAGLLKK